MTLMIQTGRKKTTLYQTGSLSQDGSRYDMKRLWGNKIPAKEGGMVLLGAALAKELGGKEYARILAAPEAGIRDHRVYLYKRRIGRGCGGTVLRYY